MSEDKNSGLHAVVVYIAIINAVAYCTKKIASNSEPLDKYGDTDRWQCVVSHWLLFSVRTQYTTLASA
jgi:hypothetical protein